MTFVELKKSNFDNTRIKVFPQQHFTSGSSLCLNTDIGELGCVPAIRTRSDSIKEIDNKSNFYLNLFHYHGIEQLRKNGPTNNKSHNHGFLYLNNTYANINKSQSDNYFFKIKRNTIEYRNPEETTDLNNRSFTDDNKNTAFYRKILVKNSLYNKYKSFSTNAEDYNYGFSNYNSLNFFTLGVHPDYTADASVQKKTHKTCVLYPNPDNKTYTPATMTGNDGEYSVSFWLNPRRTNVNGYAYNIGTILCIPGLISIYLAKGSSLDEFGYTDKFRILIDIAASSYLLPSTSLLSSASASVASSSRVVTKDNLLDKNKWYHVSVVLKNKLLRLYVDGVSVLDGITNIENLDVASTTISKTIYVGNRHNYSNKTDWINNFDTIYDYYFGSDAATDFASYDNGTVNGRASAISTFGGSLPQFEDDLDTASSDSLALNAEIADLRIYSSARLRQQVLLDMKNYVDSLTNELHLDLVFYVPLYFVPERLTRKTFVTYGDKMHLSIDGPVNPYLSHRLLGHEVSIEHFLNEFVRKVKPFIEGIHLGETDLSSTTVNSAVSSLQQASQVINKAFLTDDSTKNYRQNNLILKNNLILPNDNGLTLPSWKIINEVYPSAKDFVFSKDIFGNFVSGLVSLNEIFDLSKNRQLAGGNITQGVVISNFENGSLYRKNRKVDDNTLTKENINFTNDENFNVSSVDSLTESAIENLLAVRIGLNRSPNIFNRISVTNSFGNDFSIFARKLPLYEITSYLGDTHGPVFEISNAFFSERIKEETLEIEDKDIAGTAGALQIKLKDNQRGGMYRADSLTKHADWNYVGHVFRNEGFINILHPSLSSFGELSFDIKLKGEHGLNVFEINVPCTAGEHNVSLNKSFKKIKPTNYFSDTNEDFVFIDTINLHDENLNIVAKANLSQPLSKRITDKYNFRLKLDY